MAKVALRSAAQPDPYGCAVMPLILDLCGTCPLVLAVQKSFRAGSWPTLTSQRRFDARASVRGKFQGGVSARIGYFGRDPWRHKLFLRRRVLLEYLGHPGTDKRGRRVGDRDEHDGETDGDLCTSLLVTISEQ